MVNKKKTFFQKITTAQKVLVGGLLIIAILVGVSFSTTGTDDLQGRLHLRQPVEALTPLTPLTPIINLLPDLIIEDIYLDGDALSVVQKNQSRVGIGKRLRDEGHTYIYIDGALEWTYSWSTLRDKSFLNAGGSSIIQPQRLDLGHTLKACIDINDVINESDEENNCLELLLDEEVTRGSFADDLLSAMGTVLDPCTGGLFPDVPLGHEYCAAIETAVNDGLMDGRAVGSFAPDDFINRAEGIKVVVLAALGAGAGDPLYEAGFLDVDPLDWYAEFVNTAHEFGITTGYLDEHGVPTNYFGPADTLMQSHLDIWLNNAF